MGKDKGRTEKHYPFHTQGRTKKELKNITPIYIGKDKGRTEKHYQFSYGERQEKDIEKQGQVGQ